MPNGKYGVNSHPSETTAGVFEPQIRWPAHNDDTLKVDQAKPLTNPSMVLHPTLAFDASLVGSDLRSELYGETACENIGTCGTSKMVGSTCTGYSRGIASNGYCYESSSGTLECGRSLEASGKGATAPTKLAYASAPDVLVSRCPAGTSLNTPGVKTVRSLLVGGCMIAGDANFRATATMHVPADCAMVSEIANKGCVLPGALNYNPSAVQPDKCLYTLNGCTSSSALNYNSEATTDDSSCIEPVMGCTIQSGGYEGTASDTPGYQGRYVGVPAATGPKAGGLGLISFNGYGAVINYNAAANVMSGCIAAVEGCMDSTAANYDPAATVNSASWCVPRVVGCMLPSPATLSSRTSAPTNRLHAFDGGAINFNPSATVNDKASCVIKRIGCMDPAAVTFDARATVSDTAVCYYPVAGCLDRSAMNTGCKIKSFEKCTETLRADLVTIHDPNLCNYHYSPPPAQAPSVPPGATIAFVKVTVTLVAAGVVEDYTPAVQAAIATTFAAGAGVEPSAVSVDVTAASVNIRCEIQAPTAAAASDIQTTLTSALATPAAATSFLASAAVTVLSTPAIAQELVIDTSVAYPAPPPPEGSDAGGMIGGIVGGIGGLLMLIGIGAWVRQRRQSPNPKAIVPA